MAVASTQRSAFIALTGTYYEESDMTFPQDKEATHIEKPIIGFRLRAFTEKTFGVWVEGRVVAVSRTHIVIDFNGYKERHLLNCEFYYPSGHKFAGQSFTFKK